MPFVTKFKGKLCLLAGVRLPARALSPSPLFSPDPFSLDYLEKQLEGGAPEEANGAGAAAKEAPKEEAKNEEKDRRDKGRSSSKRRERSRSRERSGKRRERSRSRERSRDRKDRDKKDKKRRSRSRERPPRRSPPKRCAWGALLLPDGPADRDELGGWAAGMRARVPKCSCVCTSTAL